MSRHIVGLGDGATLVHTERAGLLDGATVAMSADGDGRQIVALELEGRVNKASDRVEQLFLMDEGGAAMVCAELIGVFARAGRGAEFLDVVMAALEAQKT